MSTLENKYFRKDESMKKIYEFPTIEIEKVEICDVITTSSPNWDLEDEEM